MLLAIQERDKVENASRDQSPEMKVHHTSQKKQAARARKETSQ
eukprot:SAG31_NODE_969_length_10677_cov_7.080072_9_plen_43_part_00